MVNFAGNLTGPELIDATSLPSPPPPGLTSLGEGKFRKISVAEMARNFNSICGDCAPGRVHLSPPKPELEMTKPDKYPRSRATASIAERDNSASGVQSTNGKTAKNRSRGKMFQT